MKLMTTPIRAAVALGALALAVPAAAQATTITYRDGSDIWRSSIDGAQKQQITNDGTPDSYYSLPSSDDAGDIATIKGSGTTKVIVWIRSDGTRVENVMPWKIGGGINAGPTFSRVSPDGKQLAYGYIYNKGIFAPSPQLVPHLAVVPPDAPGSPTDPMIDQPYIGEATWLNGKLVISDFQDIWAEAGPLDFKQWLSTNDTNDPLTAAEVARDNSRALVEHSNGQLELVQLDGGVPPEASHPTGSCTIQPQGNDHDSGKPRISLSADGKHVAWSDDGGVHVARVDSVGSGDCQLADSIVLSPTASMPAFSEYSIPQARPEAPQGPAGPGVTAATVKVKASKLSAKKLRKGVAVTVTVSGAGSLNGKLLKGRTALASGRAKAKAAGNVKLKLRATAKGRKQLTKLRGRKLVLRVTFVPSGGAPASKSVKVRVG